MNMMYFTFDDMTGAVSTLLAIIAALVVLTNIITQVIKQVYKAEGVPAQIVVAVVAIVLTVVTMVVGLIILKQVVFWYYYPVAIIVGLIKLSGAQVRRKRKNDIFRGTERKIPRLQRPIPDNRKRKMCRVSPPADLPGACVWKRTSTLYRSF